MSDQVRKPSPPQGHRSWLEYAIATFDSRSPTNDRGLDDELPITRDAVIAAVWAELNDLRHMAGLEPIVPRN